MPSPPVPRHDRSALLLVVVLAAVMGGFLLTSFVAQRASGEIESLSRTIASTTAPSIARLALLRGLVYQVELHLSEYLDGADRRPFDTSLRSLAETTESYLTLPLLPGERPHWAETQAALVRFEAAVRRTGELAGAGEVAWGRREFSREVQPAGERLVASSLRGIEFHAGNSRVFADRIAAARRRAVIIANTLSAVCVGLGVAGLVLVLRQSRRHHELLRVHARFHEARADELEQFAGRVAHDIRNPLSAATLAAELALARAGEHGPREAITRVLRGLARASAITTDLLAFARSGARPDPGARTDPALALEDLVRGIALEAEQRGIDVRLEPVPPVLVACSPGVYLSLVGNLVRNAVKYMGDAPTRRISLRVTVVGDGVRTEVGDTGPGIDVENVPSLFEPYFRVGHDRAQEGLGLGLATVKKLAEGHGGSVGVTSERGEGSTFWFTLPAAGAPPRADGLPGTPRFDADLPGGTS